jgi:hypothetical protein
MVLVNLFCRLKDTTYIEERVDNKKLLAMTNSKKTAWVCLHQKHNSTKTVWVCLHQKHINYHI